jgi:hypothetical protein
MRKISVSAGLVALWAASVAGIVAVALQGAHCGTLFEPVSNTLRLFPPCKCLLVFTLALSPVLVLAVLSTYIGGGAAGAVASGLLLLGIVGVALLPMPERISEAYAREAALHYAAATLVLAGLVLASRTSRATLVAGIVFGLLTVAAVALGHVAANLRKLFGALVLVGEAGLTVTAVVSVSVHALTII